MVNLREEKVISECVSQFFKNYASAPVVCGGGGSGGGSGGCCCDWRRK